MTSNDHIIIIVIINDDSISIPVHPTSEDSKHERDLEVSLLPEVDLLAIFVGKILTGNHFVFFFPINHGAFLNIFWLCNVITNLPNSYSSWSSETLRFRPGASSDERPSRILGWTPPLWFDVEFAMSAYLSV